MNWDYPNPPSASTSEYSNKSASSRGAWKGHRSIIVFIPKSDCISRTPFPRYLKAMMQVPLRDVNRTDEHPLVPKNIRSHLNAGSANAVIPSKGLIAAFDELHSAESESARGGSSEFYLYAQFSPEHPGSSVGTGDGFAFRYCPCRHLLRRQPGHRHVSRCGRHTNRPGI